MRRLGVLTAAVLLSGCFIEPSDVSTRPFAPGAADRVAFGSELPAVLATDAVVREELARARPLDASDPRRFDAAARRLGLADGAELIASVGGECLEPRALRAFAAARGLSEGAAGLYLSRRFGAVLACK
ncbi:MAG: hypothetical protein ACHQ51_14960 [Elusimicrobiota bacterium]